MIKRKSCVKRVTSFACTQGSKLDNHPSSVSTRFSNTAQHRKTLFFPISVVEQTLKKTQKKRVIFFF